MSTTYGYSVKSRDAHGLDPSVYHVHIGVARLDGEALSPAELKKIQAALQDARAPEDRAPKASKKPRPTVAKAAPARGKGKAPRKAPSAKPRKASKAPTRKAARRPKG